MKKSVFQKKNFFKVMLEKKNPNVYVCLGVFVCFFSAAILRWCFNYIVHLLHVCECRFVKVCVDSQRALNLSPEPQ